ncbi:hypothetical protein BaRGS_00037545 [Batillaria attramentaria]|uniref:VWFA domain-containing protein n=1 Tax=Batillaria attramentaria TaxID=370345 RepID=A0ABD0J964_9CAEN
MPKHEQKEDIIYNEINIVCKEAKTGCQTESDLDLAFILDASRSVSKNVFDTEKAFLLNTIDSFPSGTTRVAVITYNSTPTVERSWDRLWASESLERVKLRLITRTTETPRLPSIWRGKRFYLQDVGML